MPTDHPEPQLAFPPKGSLKRVPFARLMREIARSRLTGSLYLLSAQTKKVVFFEHGQPVFVRSNVLSECLGQILASEGLITQEQCEQTLEAIRRTGKKQGELLVEMGILSEGNLRYALEAQLRAKLFDIFAWEDGRYQFKNDRHHQDGGGTVRLRASAEGVIIEAIQHQWSEERSREAMRASDEKYPLLRAGAERELEGDVLPEEHYMLRCLDGSRTVAQVLASPNDPPVPTPAALLWGAVQSGAVQIVDQPATPRQAPARPDLSPSRRSDDELAPKFEAQDVVTEYEDTPVPGELPRERALLGDHEADFAGVGEDEEPGTGMRPKVDEELVAAEPESVDETFDDDQIEFVEEESGLIDVPAHAQPSPAQAAERPTVVESSAPRGVFLSDEDADLALPEDLAGGDVDDDLGAGLGDDFAGNLGQDLVGGEEPGLDDDLVAAADELLGGRSDLLAPEELDGVDLTGVDLGGQEGEYDTTDLGGDHSAFAGDRRADATEIEHIESIEPVELEDALAEDASMSGGDLMGLDELDALDLSGVEQLAPGAARYRGPESTFEDERADSPEIAGAIKFNEAEIAMADGDHSSAVGLLEQAYENGFDVAELHAMLAYARFMASGQDQQTADHAFELLDYAQNMDPSLDMVHAYRGAIYSALRQPQRAREALDRALELNPYCELAMQIMDSLG